MRPRVKFYVVESRRRKNKVTVNVIKTNLNVEELMLVLTMRHETLQEPTLAFVNGILMFIPICLFFFSSQNFHSMRRGRLVFFLLTFETCKDKRLSWLRSPSSNFVLVGSHHAFNWLLFFKCFQYVSMSKRGSHQYA